MPHHFDNHFIHDNPTGFDLICVDRAVHELRCGRMVCVEINKKEQAIILAAENANAQNLKAFKALAPDTQSLAITNHRAKALGLTPDDHGFGLRLDFKSLPIDTALRCADPLHINEEPLGFVSQPHPFLKLSLESAAIGLMKISKLLPTAVTAFIVNPMPAQDWLTQHNIICVLAEDIFSSEQAQANTLIRTAEAIVPLADAAHAKIIAYRPQDGGLEHLAIIIGNPKTNTTVPLVRLHSQCFTGDLLGSMRCDCGDQLRGAIHAIAAEGDGVLLYMAQEGRGIGLVNKLRAYVLQDQDFDTLEANEQLGFDEDERVYLPAALMLEDLGFSHVRLMTNNPNKVQALTKANIKVVERISHAFPANQHNEYYLNTKKNKAGHFL